ncbi:hypothetical protein KEM56_001051 [Ascosphaera pollenicola]|nr:hypothetical protein KEM56_001051 [Ascosphaera pollenicola]
MAFYSFPVFATDFYNPFASHQLLWDDEDELRPIVRRRDNGHNNDQLVKSSDNSIRNGRDSLLRMPVPKFVKSFAPKFDVRETKEGYHLDGELPGLRRKDIDIEFSDPHTLLVKGEVKREYHTSNAEEESEKEEKSEKTPESQISNNGSQRLLQSSPHQATVEDTDEDGNPIGPPQPIVSDNRTVRKERSFSGEESGRAAKKAKKQHHHHHHLPDLSPSRVKYWVSERTTGSFHRSFNFPSKVDQDGVKASLKDGLLSVFVPKQKEQKGKKKVTITVE